MKKILFFKVLCLFLPIALTTSSFAVNEFSTGLRLQENNPDELIAIENKYGLNVKLVSVILDSYTEEQKQHLNYMVEKLGKDRIYHISLSPLGKTAKQISEGAYDDNYKAFFKQIKDLNIKVVFRTMHEMNGGWYSWSSKPDEFKSAWKHVFNLSREVGLTSDNIKFIISYNSQDLPTTDAIPTQSSSIKFCSAIEKKKTGCPVMEDYYPGDEYVDYLGFTLYNWGRARKETWAKWKDFNYLLKENNLLDRLKKFNKPIFIDEIGTTSVNYTGEYSKSKSLEVYNFDKTFKNEWLKEVELRLKTEPSIIGVIYFNADITNGLNEDIPGELDWAILRPNYKVEYLQGVEFLKNQKIERLGFPTGLKEVAQTNSTFPLVDSKDKIFISNKLKTLDKDKKMNVYVKVNELINSNRIHKDKTIQLLKFLKQELEFSIFTL